MRDKDYCEQGTDVEEEEEAGMISDVYVSLRIIMHVHQSVRVRVLH